MRKFLGVELNEPTDLRVLLATMKSAKRQGINMNIWDRDIKAVEDAIATIADLRAMSPANRGGE
jgi:hypothetical protein